MKDHHHRIVLVSGGIKLGGAATFLLNLGGELARRGIPVQIVSLEHDNPYASDFAGLSIPLHVEDERTTIFEDRLSSALRIIRHFQPTAVISCLGPSSYEVLRYIPETVTRLAMLQSNMSDYSPLAAYTPFVNGVVGVSRQIEANLRAHPVLGRVPAYYLPYGILTPEEPPVRPVRELGQPIRVLYLGRLVRPQKRVHLFPEILRQLRAANVPFHWTIAGDGPERAWLEKEMISAPPKSTVEFLGAIRYRDVPAVLDTHDVFLLASDEEGLPLSLLEAMAHGLVPVVSNLASGISEVVDEKSGVLVDPGNIGGYSNGVIWLSRNPSALAAMAQRAPERIRARYSLVAMADRWLALLDSVFKGNSSDWPDNFSVGGPLNDQCIRYVPPVRALRRLVRKWLRLPAWA